MSSISGLLREVDLFSDVVVGFCWYLTSSYGQTRVVVLIFTADTG